MVLSTARKPEGGFHFISVRQLCALWCAYKAGCICPIDVQVWFAAQELVARRCRHALEHQPRYTEDELIKVTGRAGNVCGSLHRLQACGLIMWEPHAITFSLTIPDQLSSAVEAMLTQVTNSRRRVPVPRRLLRFLAQGFTRVFLATALGHLYRCMYYRDGCCQADGFCKASWIASVFGVSERAVKSARQRLEAIGFLKRTETSQWLLNRYGQKVTINLHWAGVAQHETPDSELISAVAPLPAEVPHRIAPPDSHQQLPTEEKDQEPAASRPTGILSSLFVLERARLRAGAKPLTDPAPVLVRTLSIPTQKEQSHVSTPEPAPRLQRVTLPDLKDTKRLLALYAQSVQTKLINDTEAERLTFVALAQHVLCYQPANPGGLFLRLLRRRCFAVITQAEEDAARRRLRSYLYEHSVCSAYYGEDDKGQQAPSSSTRLLDAPFKAA